MYVKRLVVGPLQVNCILLVDQATGAATVIDPGGDADTILASAREIGAEITEIVLTHFHFDHVLGLGELLAATDATLAIHALDAPLLLNPPAMLRMPGMENPKGLIIDRELNGDDLIQVGETQGTVIHTPGHSPGGIAIWFQSEGLLISGDTLFRGSIGRSDFPECDPRALLASLRRLMELPPETRVLPGHGEETTIGWEQKNNPFIRHASSWV